MEYRLGRAKDINNICHLIESAIKTMESYGIYQWDELYPAREDFEKDISKETLYVVYEDAKLIAVYVISAEFDDEYKCGKWENSEKTAFIIHRFCVTPNVQNKGIGKSVLLHIEKQIKDMGYESIRLDCYVENPFAQRLYRHNGYIYRGRVKWRKGYFDLMEKKV